MFAARVYFNIRYAFTADAMLANRKNSRLAAGNFADTTTCFQTPRAGISNSNLSGGHIGR